jgi:hypothetical protein
MAIVPADPLALPPIEVLTGGRAHMRLDHPARVPAADSVRTRVAAMQGSGTAEAWARRGMRFIATTRSRDMMALAQGRNRLGVDSLGGLTPEVHPL